MIKLNFNDEPLTLSHASRSDPGPARRLIVLVPGPEAALSPVTKRVWELAHAIGAQVQFLGLCNNAGEEATLRRTLVTASALMKSGNVSTDLEIVVSRDWVSAVRSRLQRSDMVVCSQEADSRSQQKALNLILQTDLGVPLYLLSATQPQKASRPEWLPAVAAWIGCIAIIAAFFWLQVKIDHLAGERSAPLQILSVAAEFGLIWIWNNQFK